MKKNNTATKKKVKLIDLMITKVLKEYHENLNIRVFQDQNKRICASFIIKEKEEREKSTEKVLFLDI